MKNLTSLEGVKVLKNSLTMGINCPIHEKMKAKLRQGVPNFLQNTCSYCTLDKILG